jgi:hypothetical protein
MCVCVGGGGVRRQCVYVCMCVCMGGELNRRHATKGRKRERERDNRGGRRKPINGPALSLPVFATVPLRAALTAKFGGFGGKTAAGVALWTLSRLTQHFFPQN